MSPRFFLRLEGGLIFLAALACYAMMGASWWLFAVLLLAPDVFMAGYLAGPRVGALVYNVGHVYAAPLLLGTGSYVFDSPFVGALALVWAAHIGMDRAVGYGLKRESGFHDTHLDPEPPRTPEGAPNR